MKRSTPSTTATAATACLIVLAAAIALQPATGSAQAIRDPSGPIARPVPPTANNSSVRTKVGREVFISLSVDNPSNLWVSYTVLTKPTHGTLVDYGFIAYDQPVGITASLPGNLIAPNPLPPIFIGGSSFQNYTPEAGFIGTDSFTFKASNDAGESGIATVTITVTDQNLPPTATADALTVKLGEKLWIYLGGTDPDNDSLTYTIATQPENGTLRAPTAADYNWGGIDDGLMHIMGAPSVATSSMFLYPFDPIPGMFIYEPITPQTLIALPDDWSSSDSFTFTANDGTATSAAASISITIKPANRAPVAALAISPAVEAWTSNAHTIVIANNNKTADVILDGNSSTDPDDDVLWANWFERVVKGKPAPNVRLASTEEPIAWGLSATATLSVGTHTIVGHVTDGSLESVASFTVKVITPGDAVSRLNIALRNFGAPGKYRAKLAMPVTKAAEFCKRGKFVKAAEQLHIFAEAITTYVAPKYPQDAARLTDLASAITEALIPPVPVYIAN